MKVFIRYMIKRLIQILIIAAPIVIFLGLLWADIAPSGVRIIKIPIDQVSPFVDRFLPDDRLLGLQTDSDGQAFETILDEPVYFSVHLPATEFETLEVELEFKSDAPILELGPLIDIYAQAYDLRPLQNTVIDSSEWSRLEQDGTLLLSRYGDVESISDWLSNLPDRSRIATYHYDLSTPFRLGSYTPLSGERDYQVSLRGFHKYITYIKNENFHLETTFWDMNRTSGADDVSIRVLDENGEVMLEKSLADDGDTREDQAPSQQTVILDGRAWPEGVYSVELKGTSDIFWREIKTSQRYLTFINRLYFGDEVGYLAESRPVTFYTGAKRLTFETYHADATQRVELGSQTILLPKSHEKVKQTVTDRGVVRGYAPRGDIYVTGDGKFALSADAYFDPDPIKLGPLTDLESLGIDYIVAQYQVPTKLGDWSRGQAVFDLASTPHPDGSITFAISVPEIIELQKTTEVRAINLRLEKTPLSSMEILSALWERLPFGL